MDQKALDLLSRPGKAASGLSTEASDEMKQQIHEFQYDFDAKFDELHEGKLVMPPPSNVSGPGAAMAEIPFSKLSAGPKVNSELDSEEKKDHLLKSSPSFFKGWQDRIVVLKDRKLKYFKTEQSLVPSGVINFDLFKCYVKENEKDPCIFRVGIEGNDRIFEFKAASPDSSAEWQQAIQFHIDKSEGFRFNKICRGVKKPWRFDNMSESQFKQIADTGDILLFRGS